jgi:hypothetical protein
MKISILVRTSYRPDLFNRLYDSIKAQTHQNIKVIVSYDDERALSYIPSECVKIRVYKSDMPFFYDNYVNDLKQLVDIGYFVVIDDDEVLIDNDCISRVVKHLRGSYGLICQFSRSGHLKPSNDLIKRKRIMRTKVGMPCLFLHHSLKNIAHLDGSVGASDYHWIKAVSRKVSLKFVPIVVAYADRRSNGVI